MSGSEHSASFDAGKYPDHIAYNHKAAMQIFEDVANGGRLHIASISADERAPVSVRAFTMPHQRTDIVVMMRTIDEGNHANTYFCPNSSIKGNEMPDDASVTELRAVIVDIDPMDTTSDEAWIAERLRVKQMVHAALHHEHLKPSLAIDTGNGAQLVYLIKRIPADAQSSTLLRATMKSLSRQFGGDIRAAHKTSGLFRVPGTRNIPNASKLKRGRHVAYGGIWHRDASRVYDLKALYTIASDGQPENPDDKPEEEKTPGAIGLTLNQLIDQSRDLPEHLRYRIQAKSSDSKVFKDHMWQMTDAMTSRDRSKDDYRFVLMLLADSFTPAEAAVCLGYFGATKATPQYSDRWVRYVIGTVLNAVAAAPKPEDFWTEPEPEPKAEAKSEPPKDEPKADDKKRRWFTAAELNARPFGGDRPLVQKLLPKRGLSMVYGESNSGKSLVALDICSCVASGVPFGGLRVDAEGLVVYIAMEGGGGLHKRIKAMVLQNPDRNLERLVCIIEPFSLHGEVSDARDLVEILKEIRAAHGGMHIDLLVIDMLAIAASGANENSAEDMSKVLDRISKIEQMFTCHVMTLHHTGKVLARGARGWSGLRGRVDTEIEIGTTKVHKTGYLAVTKQRDMDFNPYDKQGYVIRSMHLGDDDDRPVSGAVIELMRNGLDDETVSDMTEAEQEVFDLVVECGTPVTSSELAEALGKSQRAVLHILNCLIKKKHILATTNKPRRYMPYLGFNEENDNGPVDPFS